MRRTLMQDGVPSFGTLGTAFPDPPFHGVVHSVHRSAVNVIDGSTGTLCTLMSDESLAHPLAATVRYPDGAPVQFESLGLRVGSAAHGDRDVLVLDGKFTVSCAGARRVDPTEEMPPDGLMWNADTVAASGKQLSVLQEAANTVFRWASLSARHPDGSMIVSRFRTAAVALADAVARRSLASATGAAISLVGLGPGLTPAGDDFVCGFCLAAYVRTKSSPESARHIPLIFVNEWLDCLLDQAAGDIPRTGKVSLTFLFLARRQLFPRAMITLARAFATEGLTRTCRCAEALEVLGRLGHSSGYDAATGFLFGLEPGAPSLH